MEGLIGMRKLVNKIVSFLLRSQSASDHSTPIVCRPNT